MTNCNTVSTPADPHQRLTKTGSTTKEQKQHMEKVSFRQLIGGLQFLAHCTRSDIAYAVNVVSSFSSDPSEVHWVAAKRILRYLKGTKSMKLTFRKQSAPSFEGFSDADWAFIKAQRVVRLLLAGLVQLNHRGFMRRSQANVRPSSREGTRGFLLPPGSVPERNASTTT
ncbi:uncharacterized protein LOC134290165 [Aedes albopictus]|uniref:Reverse transcriptase Ty1/copia-type domain-containing protein n=1 Tax=Aedes albopictus TaxID=7160 RepID=A0ABM1ZN47_AEDAL